MTTHEATVARAQQLYQRDVDDPHLLLWKLEDEQVRRAYMLRAARDIAEGKLK